MYSTIVNIPQVRDADAAIRLYYEQKELSLDDICRIFACCRSTAARLKRRGVEEMALSDTPAWNTRLVNTKCAFRSWGVNIEDLERGKRQLAKLRLNGGADA